MKDTMETGIFYAPYIMKTTKFYINGEIVWYSNKWKNFLLKIKHFFYTSKNRKSFSKYQFKPVNKSFYTTVNISGSNQ